MQTRLQAPQRAELGLSWWQRGVIYQIYVRSFQDSNGDGVGDLGGVIERLDYITDVLGVDAIWLTPFYRSPMHDGGYDIANHSEVDPTQGNLATFDELLARAHDRGLKILLDFVATNTSDQHAWFAESRASRTNPKRDWYIWRDPKPDGSPPNNWLSMWGGPAWTLDPATGQYYLHAFFDRIPDLNWHNTEVRQAMYALARFWLDRGVDGFRVDAVLMLMKDPELRDNPPSPTPSAGLHKPMGPYGAQLHLYDGADPGIHSILRELRLLLDEYGAPERVMVGEVHADDWNEWASYYGANLDELHFPFNFGLLHVAHDPASIRAVVDAVEAALPPGAWPDYVLGNHDEHRVASRVGATRAPLLMMLLLTLRGTPTIYYGDELGLPDVPISPDLVRDPWELGVPGLGLGRDPQRSPIPWESNPNGGFCREGIRPWLPLIGQHTQRSVESQLTAPDSMLSLTRRLLRLRHETPALHRGVYHSCEAPDDCIAYVRAHAEQRLLVALNFSRDERTVALPEPRRGTVVASTSVHREGAAALGAIRLAPYQGCAVELEVSE
jgi:alpha-glucosidase